MFERFKSFLTKGVNTQSGVWFDALKRPNQWNGNFLDAYAINLYVNAAIRKRANKLSEIEFVEVTSDGEEKDDTDLVNILYNPNSYMSKKSFWRTYQILKDCYGEVFIWIEAKKERIGSPASIKALHLLEPDRMQTIWQDGEITGYKYTRKGDGKIVPYKPEEVIRDYYPDPKDSLQAMSLLKAGYYAIDTDNQLSQYHSNILKNGGKVENVIKFKNELSRTQIEEMKDQYDKQFAQAKKSGKPLFLGGDADVVSMGLKPEELSFLESKKLMLDDIVILTEVPKVMLGAMTDIKYDNADASIRIFLKETIKPLMNEVVAALDSSPKMRTANNNYLDFVDPVPENAEEKRKNLETANKIYALTINEKREELGYDPLPDKGDEILVPQTLIGYGETREDDDNEGGQGQGNEENNEEEKNIKNNNKGGGINYLKDKEVRRKYHFMKEKRLAQREKEMETQVKNFFENQKSRLLEYIQNDLGKSYSPKTKQRKIKNLLDQHWNQEREEERAKEVFSPILAEYLKQSGQESLNFLDYEYGFKIGGDLESWLDERTNLLSKQINETTFKQLKEQFQESIANGETKEQLVTRVRDTYGNITDNKARTIATTEVHGVMQKGTYEAYRQSGMRIKIWVSIIDERTRLNHRLMDGEEAPLNGYFSNGLKFPGDPSGSPSQIVNCRCTV